MHRGEGFRFEPGAGSEEVPANQPPLRALRRSERADPGCKHVAADDPQARCEANSDLIYEAA
jgi:hypothetical protein